MHPSVNHALSLPITRTGRLQAQAFQQQHPQPEKAEQVYWNTLAVWVVKDYLNLMQIPCDLEGSDSWSPLMQTVADQADLAISGLGRLECRPIFPGQTTCHVPPEVWSERIGYVVVMFDPTERQGHLLGFTPTVATAELPCQSLQPLDALLVHLNELVAARQSTAQTNCSLLYTNLNQWYQGLFEQGWQAVESLVPKPSSALAYNFRSIMDLAASSLNHQPVRVKRAKIIDFGAPMPDLSLVLALNLLESAASDLQSICVQAFPLQEASRLPLICFSSCWMTSRIFFERSNPGRLIIISKFNLVAILESIFIYCSDIKIKK
ncbi:MAG: DUF1822 family protein [Acaryochloridaceae cyanobacterium CSU_5_19]|nr:DUF1822 family protein [Acaryochloridaceae cyanobacterium CSU_5_19]